MDLILRSLDTKAHKPQNTHIIAKLISQFGVKALENRLKRITPVIKTQSDRISFVLNLNLNILTAK